MCYILEQSRRKRKNIEFEYRGDTGTYYSNPTLQVARSGAKGPLECYDVIPRFFLRILSPAYSGSIPFFGDFQRPNLMSLIIIPEMFLGCALRPTSPVETHACLQHLKVETRKQSSFPESADNNPPML